MGFYRFMESQHLDDVLKGKLRFTALSYYRLLEKVYQNDWIGDSHEGQAITVIDKVDIQPGKDDYGMRKKLEALKILSGSYTSAQLDNVKYIDREEGFVLSFAVGELDVLKESMSRGSYNACVSFQDIDLLATMVYLSGVTSDGKAVSDVFFPPEVGAVAYSSNEVDLRHVDGHLPASPLLKRESYSAQKEWRIFFKPKIHMNVDVVTVSTDFPKECIEEEFREAITPPGEQWPTLGEVKDPLGLLQSIRTAIYLEKQKNTDVDIGQYFTDVHYRPALLAYWQLRKEHRWSVLDFYFSMDDFNGAIVSGLMVKFDHYVVRVTGIDEFDIGRGDA